MSEQQKYIGDEQEWYIVHQPFELRYHQQPNFRWPGQEAIWNEQWDNVFHFAGLNKDSFTNNQLMLDVGCGSKPSLDWFNAGDKYGIDPLLEEYRKIPTMKDYWNDHKNDHFLNVPAEQQVSKFNNKFDFVLCWNVLDHCFDAEKVLRNIYFYAKADAVILIGTDMSETPHLGHPGIKSREAFMSVIRELFMIEKEVNSAFKYCRQRAFVLRKKTIIQEKDKYDGIYANTGQYRGYGHSNHGRGAITLTEGATSILDVGCGYNEFIKGIKQTNPNIKALGVDFSCPGADKIVDAKNLPFNDKEWEIITSFDMLEHLLPDEVPVVLREFARVSHKFIFSICYRPSVILWKGHNLHPTVQPESWWINEITKAGGKNIKKHENYLVGEWPPSAAEDNRRVTKKKLTIGMLTYDDFDGVYFSIQSIRLHHPEIIKDIEFLILDNNPNSKHGEAVKNLTNWIKDAPVRYIPITDKKGTAQRDKIFSLATTPYVLCMDCHVMFPAGAIAKLIEYMDTTQSNDLLHGPMLYDNMSVAATHMNMVWRAGMQGIWDIDQRGLDAESDPFDIPAHGMGVFACKQNAWLGFNVNFNGFGGEECYIHNKFRQHGRRVICLPFLRWLHRFPRPSGVPYPVRWEDRVRNYIIGHEELGIPTDEIIEHFSGIISADRVQEIIQQYRKHN